MVGSSAEEVANFNILIYVVGFERRVRYSKMGNTAGFEDAIGAQFGDDSRFLVGSDITCKTPT